MNSRTIIMHSIVEASEVIPVVSSLPCYRSFHSYTLLSGFVETSNLHFETLSPSYRLPLNLSSHQRSRKYRILEETKEKEEKTNDFRGFEKAMDTRGRYGHLVAQSSASLPAGAGGPGPGEPWRRESMGAPLRGAQPVNRRLDLLRSRDAHSEPASMSKESDSEISDEERSESDGPPGQLRSNLSSRQSDPTATRPRGSPLSERTTSAFSLPVQSTQEYYDRSLITYQNVVQDLTTNEETHRQIAIGRRIGFYRLGKELGQGNFSKVKVGVHVLTSERVAVKIMEKARMDAKAQRLLTREIENTEQCRHAHIIQMFEVVETIARVHLVIEYARGGELYAYVHEKGKLSEKEAKPLYAQVMSAIMYLHSRNIAHRDIKAENIMFSEPGGSLKLVDFGFSRILTDEQLHTFCGSPPYAAPELFRDSSYDGRAVDVWAMGVLLYFMLVGVTPFRGENVPDLKARVIEGSFHMPEYLSFPAQSLIKFMLELNPQTRISIHGASEQYWMAKSKFPQGIEDEEIPEQVHARLQSMGITDEMLMESQEKDKGAKCDINGTLRLVCYQLRREAALTVQKEREAKMTADREKFGSMSLRNKRGVTQKSDKICSIS